MFTRFFTKLAIVKIRRASAAHQPSDAAYIFWGEILFYVAGISFVYFGLLHAYAQNIAAPSIGWKPSPFEYELGWASIGLGVVAIVSLWRGYEFRLATSIAFIIFGWAAAAQHINQIVCCHNDAPGNAGLILWFSDITVPLVVLILALMSHSSLKSHSKN